MLANFPNSEGFARKLNLFDATMIVISGIIGSGIFINPYIVAQKVGTPFLILAVWIAGGVFALAGAALMVFRRTMPDAPRPQPVPLYPLIPILFILVRQASLAKLVRWKS